MIGASSVSFVMEGFFGSIGASVFAAAFGETIADEESFVVCAWQTPANHRVPTNENVQIRERSFDTLFTLPLDAIWKWKVVGIPGNDAGHHILRQTKGLPKHPNTV